MGGYNPGRVPGAQEEARKDGAGLRSLWLSWEPVPHPLLGGTLAWQVRPGEDHWEGEVSASGSGLGCTPTLSILPPCPTGEGWMSAPLKSVALGGLEGNVLVVPLRPGKWDREERDVR